RAVVDHLRVCTRAAVCPRQKGGLGARATRSTSGRISGSGESRFKSGSLAIIGARPKRGHEACCLPGCRRAVTRREGEGSLCMHRFTSFMALGDSFTEGMNDELPDGTFRGGADRLAEMLAKDNPGFSSANLAIRGKPLRPIRDEQPPAARAGRPDRAAVCAGGNDVIAPGSNVDHIAEMFDGMIRQLVEAGIDVLIFTGPDVREVSVVNRLRGKVALYNAHLHAIAQKYRTRVVDLWAMEPLRDPRAFSEDRLHFSPEAHRRIALRVAEELGLPVEQDWREPWPKP